jgi:hypothetical protein
MMPQGLMIKTVEIPDRLSMVAKEWRHFFVVILLLIPTLGPILFIQSMIIPVKKVAIQPLLTMRRPWFQYIEYIVYARVFLNQNTGKV